MAYVWRPNRDGTQTSFTADDGKWKPVPASVEQKYTTIDHEPVDGSSPDNAWIITSAAGTAKTYFHLWDVSTLSADTVFSQVVLRASIDFAGKGTGWKLQKINMQPIYNPGSGELRGNDMNAAILEVVANEDAHTLTFTLYNSATGRAMTRPAVFTTTVAVTGRQKIALEAVQIETFGTSLDESYSCKDCKVALCGNNRQEGQEECDDGNAANDDGCTFECKVEICRLPPER